MRAAYLDDLRSKFLLENSVLKMEYAEVRVLHLGYKVGRAHAPSPPSRRWPASLFLRTRQCLYLLLRPQPRHSASPALLSRETRRWAVPAVGPAARGGLLPSARAGWSW